MTKKKFTYKVPSMVALTLAGTALTTHQAQAADDAQNQSTNGNVLDDKNTLKQSEQIKSEVSKPTANISGTQSYQDPTQVQQTLANEVNTYDAELDELNSEQTPSQDTYNQQTEDQANTQSEANEVTENNQDSENAQSIEQNSVQDNASSDVSDQQTEEDTSAQNVQDNEDNSTDDTTTLVDNSQAVANSQPTEQNSAQDNASADVSEQQTEEDTSAQNIEDNSTDDTTTSDDNSQAVANSQSTEQNSAQDNASADVSEQQSEEDTSAQNVQDNEDNSTDDTTTSDDNSQAVANSQPTEQNSAQDNASADVSEQQSEEDTSNKDVQDDEDAKASENNKEDSTSSDLNEQDSEDVQQFEEDTSNKDVQDDEDAKASENNKEDSTSSDLNEQDSEDVQQFEEDTSNKDVQDDEDAKASENNKEDSTSSDLNEQDSEDAQQSEEDTTNEDVQDDEDAKASENNKEDSTSSDLNEQDSEDNKEDSTSSDLNEQDSEDNKEDNTSSDLNEQDSEDAQQSEEDTSDKDVQDDEDATASEDNKEDSTSSDLNEQDSEDAQQSEEDTSDKDVQDDEDATASEDNKEDSTSSDLNEQDSEDAQQSEEDTSDKDVQDDEDATTSEDNKEDSNATSTATAVATKSSAPSATATTLSPEATPKLRVASADSNNTCSTRAAVTKEAGTTSSLPAYTPQVNSSLNDYIRNNNFVAPTYEQDIASFLPQYSYRYGKPEGIVLHETANDNSTITGEINYMKNNYNSAFVHAYIDGDRIIETANTDYLAWGAGPAANDRFIHVELVHTHDYDSFARSINNYADYAATNLLYYGLSPDSAEYDGQGTVWTHQAVSTFLGGSNHTDPHGYLASFNYSYDELYDLIYEKYLIKTGQVTPWGESSSGSTSGSDDSNENVETDTPDNNTGSEEPDNTGNTNEPSNGSGSVEDNDNTANNDTTSSNQLTITELTNKQGTVSKSNHGVYTSVYDKQGVQKSYVNGNTFKLSKKAMLGNNGFYLITDNDTNTNLGWMQTGDITVTEVATKPEAKPAAKPVTKPVSNNTQNQSQNNTQNQTQNKTQNQTQSVSKIGQLNNTNSGIKTTVNDTKAKDASKLSGRTFNVTKQRTQGDNTYVLIQNANQNTPLGWVNTKDINTRDLSKTSAKNGQFTVKSTNNGLYAVPWGTKSQQLDSLKNVKNNQFNASKSVQVDKDEYVYGNVNNKAGWIAAKDLNTNTNTNTNQNNKVVTEAQTSDVTKSAVTPYKFDYVIYNADGSYYLDPTSAQPAGSLKDFYESIFTVFEKQVINGVTWYHGKLSNGQMVWIKEEDLRKELIKYYQSGLTLDEAVAIQAGLKTKPQIQHTPGKWEDATPIEIKNAMDTGKLAQDPTQKYQFLRLDKSQDISSADLDKLLVGKGILEGQGEAFSEAAKAYNINEVYLISHALLETGDGTSELANGGDVVDDKVVTDGPNKYYNMFGIGAVDSDAVKQGFATAKSNGWDTVKKAIVGGAKFISSSYISQGQNTLYKMRWNPENPGEHQYATDVRWAEHNATRIKGFYDSMGKLGKYFDVNTYKA
ncbi:GW dipeptide domain-containing protein [Staphylococcus sp. IPLA37010]|uniref:Bifunctional autolysin n=1 Tax=Staphylococcus equorum TaxID=246432 RepID=A0AAW7ADA1_9STAP|nr:GW dipeptide domain-containing protein [Staphylococcus equorum]MDK9865021.1 glucosaminidase domain-containing protein [Staphylococcus equorum]